MSRAAEMCAAVDGNWRGRPGRAVDQMLVVEGVVCGVLVRKCNVVDATLRLRLDRKREDRVYATISRGRSTPFLNARFSCTQIQQRDVIVKSIFSRISLIVTVAAINTHLQ